MPSPRTALPSLSKLLALLLCALTALAAGGATAAQAGPLDLDPSFGSAGVVLTGAAQGGRWSAVHAFADGSFLAAGEVANDTLALTKRRADGTPDPAFGTGGLVTFGVARARCWRAACSCWETAGSSSPPPRRPPRP
jgi:hypothetical protein